MRIKIPTEGESLVYIGAYNFFIKARYKVYKDYILKFFIKGISNVSKQPGAQNDSL